MKDHTTQSMYEIEQNNYRPNDVLQYHNISRQWEENDNYVDQEEFKSIDQFNKTLVKNYSTHVRQSPVDCQRKVSIAVKIYFLFICVLNYIQLYFRYYQRFLLSIIFPQIVWKR